MKVLLYIALATGMFYFTDGAFQVGGFGFMYMYESVRNLVSLEAHASLDKTSICRNLLLILGIFCCRIFLLLLV